MGSSRKGLLSAGTVCAQDLDLDGLVVSVVLACDTMRRLLPCPSVCAQHLSTLNKHRPTCLLSYHLSENRVSTSSALLDAGHPGSDSSRPHPFLGILPSYMHTFIRRRPNKTYKLPYQHLRNSGPILTASTHGTSTHTRKQISASAAPEHNTVPYLPRTTNPTCIQ